MSSKTISTGGANYTTSSTYDSYGRPYELTYPSSGAITGPVIRTEYSNGAAYKTTDYSSGSAGTVYHHTTAVNARGQSTAVNYGDKVTASFSYGYDALGNLTSKPGVGNYSFTYDANGNVTNDGKRSFTYTAFEKPSKIQQNNDFTDFEYGPNRELIKRIDKRGNNITTTLMLDGYEQITLPTGVVEHKYSVGDAIITKRSNDSNETYYLHKDQQGSTTAITNKDGVTVQQLMYDPWGKQHVVNTSLLTYTSPAKSKGYTGHEMVNDFEVIHMGGRTYNPVLGRFMQADPFIQSPGNLQSYNRYSYVMNNPMSYTDPSGYFFKKIGKFIKDNWRTIASIAIAVYMPGMAFMDGLSAIQAGALTGFVSGGVATGSLRGALVGGLTGGAFGGLHNWGSKLIARGIDIGRIGAHGLVGGISSVLGGGKFGHGFVAAGFTQAASEMGGESLFVDGATEISDRAGNAIKAAVIGGSASALSGGKFGNGAITGAFSRLLNDDAKASKVQETEEEKIKKWGEKALESDTIMVTRPDGVQQTLDGRMTELIYGPDAKLNSCGAVDRFACRASIFFGGEIPEELNGLHLQVIHDTNEAVSLLENATKVPGAVSIPIKAFNGSFQWMATKQICQVACDVKNKRIDGGGKCCHICISCLYHSML